MMTKDEALRGLTIGDCRTRREAVKTVKELLNREECENAISRQAVEDKLIKLCDSLEEIFANIRMMNVDESVCGLCEYDCPAPFECKGFETDECFKLAYEIRHKWQSTKDLPSVIPTCEEREKGECPYYAG